MDQSVSGTTYYRSVSNSSQIDNEIRKYFSYAKDFKTRWALIATWEKVGYYNRHADKVTMVVSSCDIVYHNVGEHFSTSFGY